MWGGGGGGGGGGERESGGVSTYLTFDHCQWHQMEQFYLV